MIRVVCFMVVLAFGVASATADEYWVAYEGNDFPENEGWTRVYGDEYGYGHGGAERWIEDGALVIDSMRHYMIVDFYLMERPIDPGPGELFIMRWRFRFDQSPGGIDPDVGVFSDSLTAIDFAFSPTEIRSGLDPSIHVPIDLWEYRTFELRSADMLQYELLVDDTLALSGQFVPVVPQASSVAWGDGIQGGRSQTRWDFFEFGVVPEPTPGVPLVGALLLLTRNRER